MSNQNIINVSIIMPLYNKEADVLRSINSVLKQTATDWELVVVNDGSTDKGPEIVRSVDDQRIRVFDQANQGVSAARNKGIADAKADLIAFLDADDEWAPDFLETILRLKDKFPDCDVYATSYYIAHNDGYKRKAILRGLNTTETEFRLDNYFEVATQSDPPLWTSAVAVSTKAIMSVGGFPVGVSTGEDLLTWARLALKFRVAYCSIAKAYFWEPLEVSDRPGRVPQVPDIVGDELEVLKNNDNMRDRKDFSDYVALWHTMRSDIFIRVGDNNQASQEINKAIRYSGMNAKLMFLFIVAKLPGRCSIRLYFACKRLFVFMRRLISVK